MPEPQDLEVLILLTLIPVVIAAMYSLVRAMEDVRDRAQHRGSTGRRG